MHLLHKSTPEPESNSTVTSTSTVPGPLTGKVAIVTGASRGIGAAIVQRLADHGAHVVVNYASNADAANDDVNAINSKRSSSSDKDAAIAVKADVSSIAGATELVQQTVAAFGRVDVLVMNAGTMGYSTLADLSEEFFDKSVDCNIKGPVFLVKAASGYIQEDECCVSSDYIYSKISEMTYMQAAA